MTTEHKIDFKTHCIICNAHIAKDSPFRECLLCRNNIKEYRRLNGVNIPPKTLDEKVEFLRLYNLRHNTAYTYGDYISDKLSGKNKFL